jgi:hypothetical protein
VGCLAAKRVSRSRSSPLGLRYRSLASRSREGHRRERVGRISGIGSAVHTNLRAASPSRQPTSTKHSSSWSAKMARPTFPSASWEKARRTLFAVGVERVHRHSGERHRRRANTRVANPPAWDIEQLHYDKTRVEHLAPDAKEASTYCAGLRRCNLLR